MDVGGVDVVTYVATAAMVAALATSPCVAASESAAVAIAAPMVDVDDVVNDDVVAVATGLHKTLPTARSERESTSLK